MILRSFPVVVLALAAVVLAVGEGFGRGPALATGSEIASISTGSGHTCVVTAAGGAACWGDNFSGQLGNGTNADRSIPVDVVGLTSNVASVSAGVSHTCALTTAGGVKCWGNNLYGQLGNGQVCPAPCNTPVDVVGLASGVAAVSVGGGHTCALTVAGGVKCWGSNYDGQLGDGQSCGIIPCTPTDVTGLTSGVLAISAGSSHTCALTDISGVKCWGSNFRGQLGATAAEQCFGFPCSTTPIDVTGLSTGVAAVSTSGVHTCALTTGGGVKCWGDNTKGQLGDGQSCGATDCVTPVDVVGLASGVAVVSAGGPHSCALTTGGGVKCWGGNADGQLGDGQVCGASSCSIAVDVTGLMSGGSAVASGGSHTCALMTSGSVKCWGRNTDGALGNGTKISQATPTDSCLKACDIDFDGCPNSSEEVIGSGAESSGGNREPENPWDYFNPSHDGRIRVDDVLLVLNQYFDDDDDSNPGLTPYEPGYNPDTDRTLVGPKAWNLGAPNGLQRVDDILNVLKQYFHDCS